MSSHKKGRYKKGRYKGWNAHMLGLALFMVVVLGLCVGCEFQDNQSLPGAQASTEETAALPVNVVRASISENVYEIASYYGELKARRSSSLGFATAGRVAEVFATVGSTVKEGDKIAVLEQAPLESQAKSLKKELATANGDLTTLSAAFRSQENQRQLDQVQQRISSLTSQQTEVNLQLEKGTILAPYDAVISSRSVDEGETVPGGRPFFEVFEAGQPIVELHVPSEIAQKIPLGQPVWIKKDRVDVQAEVATTSPALGQSSRTQMLTLNVTDTQQPANWTYGETIEVQFWIPTVRSGYWLPYTALQSEANGLWSAFVLKQDGEQQFVSRRIVEILQLEDKHALVQGSINDGDFFIANGLNRVLPGQRVVGKVVANDHKQLGIPGAGE